MKVMISARKGGGGTKVGVRPGGRSMNTNIPWWAFFLCGQSFLSTWGPFSPCGGSLSPCGVGAFLVLPPPKIFFAGAPCCQSFYCTAISFMIFPDSGGLNLSRELFDPLKNLPHPPHPHY